MAVKNETSKKSKKTVEVAVDEVTEEVKKKEPKQISKKSAFIIIIIAVGLVLLALYLYWWYSVKQEEKYASSYLLNSGTVSLEIKNLDEVNQIMSEAPNTYFVLITYTGDKHNYELEEGLKILIDKYNFSDCFYYLNIENIINEDNYLARLNTAFNTDLITKVPTILYYQDGELIDSVKRVDNNPINDGDFQKLIEIYGFESGQ